MKYWILAFFVSIFLVSAAFAQKRKIIKPKPEEETGKSKVTQEELIAKRKRAFIRSKLPVQPKHRLTGLTVSTYSNDFLGFGANYHLRQNKPLAWTFYGIYYPVPSDEFYFDPYYWEFYQRNRGSIFMVTFGAKYRLPIMKDEPNIHPYWIIGLGPVLGVQYDWARSFPSSWVHAYSVGGLTAYSGFGLEYFFGDWVLGADLRYQSISFRRRLFSKKQYNALAFSFNFGKMF